MLDKPKIDALLLSLEKAKFYSYTKNIQRSRFSKFQSLLDSIGHILNFRIYIIASEKLHSIANDPAIFDSNLRNPSLLKRLSRQTSRIINSTKCEKSIIRYLLSNTNNDTTYLDKYRRINKFLNDPSCIDISYLQSLSINRIVIIFPGDFPSPIANSSLNSFIKDKTKGTFNNFTSKYFPYILPSVDLYLKDIVDESQKEDIIRQIADQVLLFYKLQQFTKPPSRLTLKALSKAPSTKKSTNINNNNNNNNSSLIPTALDISDIPILDDIPHSNSKISKTSSSRSLTIKNDNPGQSKSWVTPNISTDMMKLTSLYKKLVFLRKKRIEFKIQYNGKTEIEKTQIKSQITKIEELITKYEKEFDELYRAFQSKKSNA